MVLGIVHSVSALIWAVLLLISMMFLFSVVILNYAVDENDLQHHGNGDLATLAAKDFKDLMFFYGSLSRTIYTLYLSIVGGIDWSDAAQPLMKLSTSLGLLFC